MHDDRFCNVEEGGPFDASFGVRTLEHEPVVRRVKVTLSDVHPQVGPRVAGVGRVLARRNADGTRLG